MARHRISKLILLPLLLASLSGCQIGDSPSLSDSSVANADRYDSPDVSVASLEADGCMAFEDMYFARGEEKDHAFRFKDGKITEHVTCPKVKFNKENYEKLPGKPFFEVIQKIGIPHFRGEEATHSVSYLCKDGNERSLSLSLDAESRWTVSVVKEKEIIYHLKNFVDRESSYKPSLERCKKIRMGMYLSDVLFILGRPLQNTDSNGATNCWGISSGGTIHIMHGSTVKGDPFFDDSVFIRDEYSHIYNIIEGSKTVQKPGYWSVSNMFFNEKGLEAFPDGDFINK